jgi:hypothetical protein
MKKKLLLIFTFLLLAGTSFSQITCIRCFNTNNTISPNANNLISNGSFEIGCGAGQNFWPGAGGGCVFQDWVCTGGGNGTYAHADSYSLSMPSDGNIAPYMGNWYCTTCSNVQGDTSCLVDQGCEMTLSVTGYLASDPSYGGATGLSLSQTVTGLTVGQLYELEFWAGGEGFTGSFENQSIFGVDIGFGYNYLKCQPTPASGSAVGTEYIIEFYATSTTHVIKFTNWGHICFDCTELVLDNVRLYTAAELNPVVTPCVPIGPIPTAVISCSDSSFCGKQGINFYDLSTNNPTSWNWTFQGAVPSSSTLQNPVNIYYPNYGTFDVTLVACNANGCDTIYMPDYVVEFQTPNVTVTQSNDTLFAAGNGNSFQWYTVAGGILNGATDPFYVATIPGEYYCVVTDSLGCQGASPNFLVTDVNELDAFREQIELLPNPFTSQLTIQSSNTEEKELVIFDVTSRELIRENFTETHTINTEGLSKGVYFYEIKGKNGGFKAGRIIKQ